MDPLERMLVEGMMAMKLSSTEEQRGRLLVFLRLLRKWNRVYNLTSIESPEDMVRLHLLDSLAVHPYLKGSRVLDVGTGAGLPGLPLAVMSPDREFILLDSSAKKTRFVQQAAIEMGLLNVRVEQARIERYRPQQGFDTILARAFASLPEMMEEASRLLNPGGAILALKGKLREAEIQPLKNAIVETFPLAIPGIDAERHLIALYVRG